MEPETSHAAMEANDSNKNPFDSVARNGEFYKSPLDKSERNEDEVKFRIKQRNVRHPISMSIKKTEKMIVLFTKISEKLGLDKESFSLFFDGDKIKWSDTVESLDIEEDECLELFEKINIS